VRLLGTVLNATATRLQVECPVIGFYVRDEHGDTRWLYEGVMFLCTGHPGIGFGESDSRQWAWVPEEPGTYELWAALDFRRNSPGGPGAIVPLFPSDPIEITVE
jgi:hypothetical protein